MRKARSAVVVLGLVVAGCGSSKTLSSSATSRLPRPLADAIQRTLAVSSLRIEAVPPDASGASVVSIYQSPDREETIHAGPTSGSLGAVLIDIGDTSYVEDRPNHYLSRAKPGGGTAAVKYLFLPLYAAQHADSVSGNGPTYHFTSSETTGTVTTVITGDLRVSDGFVTEANISVTGSGSTTPGPLQIDYRLSKFNSAPPVTAPPSDEVTPQPPGGSCTTFAESDVTFCSGTASTTEPPPPVLPKPTITARSSLQFRPVRSVGGQCNPASGNPPADQPTALPESGGPCFQLDATVLTVTNAAATAQQSQVPGPHKVDVRLDLNSADASAFDGVAQHYYQQQVAIVMFGKVLSAPTINAEQFNGSVIITGIDPQTASNVIAALNP